MTTISFDRRRINGPDGSQAPKFLDKKVAEDHILRRGRSKDDIRPIFLSTGLISQANGSAYIETEKAKIICAVYGPRQLKNMPYNEVGQLNVEVKFAPFSCSLRRAPLKDAEDRPLSLLIQQGLVPSLRLDLLPKSCVDVFITILEHDGFDGCAASGIIAASTALADARVEMYGLVTACSSATIENEIWLDPTAIESEKARNSLILACMPALGTITCISQIGSMTPSESFSCIDRCQNRCKDIHDVVVAALSRPKHATDVQGS